MYVALFLASAQEEGFGVSDGLIPERVAPAASDDPQRDRIFDGLISTLGGIDEAIEVVQAHGRVKGRAVSRAGFFCLGVAANRTHLSAIGID